MAVIRVFALLLVTSLVRGQELSSPKLGQSNTPEPKPSVVDDHACPGKGKRSVDYDHWLISRGPYIRRRR